MSVEIATQPPLLVPRFFTPTSWCKVPLYLKEALFMRVWWPSVTLETSKSALPQGGNLTTHYLSYGFITSLMNWQPTCLSYFLTYHCWMNV